MIPLHGSMDHGMKFVQYHPGQSCVKNGEINSKLMSVSTWAIKPNNFQRTDTYYDFNMTILNSSFGDNGIHFIRHLKSDNQGLCRIIRVNVIVRDIPLCTSVITKTGKHMNFSCSWIPLDYRDRIQLRTGNKTMQSYEREWIPDTETTSTYRNITIRVTVSIQDAFDKNRIPDTCIVSNNRSDFRNMCTFPIDMYMIPEMHEFNEYGQNVSFICCTNHANSDHLPDVWWYDNITKATKAKGRAFTITSTQRGGDDRENVIFIICGEDNDAELSSFRIGQLILNLKHHTGAFLSGIIDPFNRSILVVPEGEKRCNQSYLITVTANLFRHENNTQDITPYKDNFAIPIPDSSTSYSLNVTSLPTNTSCTTQSDILSPANGRCSGVCGTLKTLILSVTIVAIFFFLTIAVCVRYKVKLRNTNTPAGGNNPQVNLRSRNGSNDETYEMALMSPELSHVANKESCPSGTSTVKSGQQIIPSSPRNKFRWRQSVKRQHECTMPKGLPYSKSLILSNHSKNKALARCKSSAVTIQALGEDKPSAAVIEALDTIDQQQDKPSSSSNKCMKKYSEKGEQMLLIHAEVTSENLTSTSLHGVCNHAVFTDEADDPCGANVPEQDETHHEYESAIDVLGEDAKIPGETSQVENTFCYTDEESFACTHANYIHQTDEYILGHSYFSADDIDEIGNAENRSVDCAHENHTHQTDEYILVHSYFSADDVDEIRNINTQQMAGPPTEYEGFYEIVHTDDHHDDYMPLQRNDHSYDPVYQPLQDLAAHSREVHDVNEERNINPQQMAALPTEHEGVYETIDTADHPDDYMPLQKIDHSCDAVYQPLQDLVALSREFDNKI